jgi:hypothetical protein
MLWDGAPASGLAGCGRAEGHMLVLLLQDIRVHIRGNPEVEEAESVGLRSTQPRIVGSWHELTVRGTAAIPSAL